MELESLRGRLGLLALNLALLVPVRIAAFAEFELAFTELAAEFVYLAAVHLQLVARPLFQISIHNILERLRHSSLFLYCLK